MKVVNVSVYPQKRCNAPRGCDNLAEFIVTIEPNDQKYRYKTYTLCAACKDRAEEASAS